MIDLTDVDAFVRGDHFAMFRWLRENDPVHWHPLPDGGGFWALTRHHEVTQAYLDSSTFGSSGGAMLGGSYRNEADTAGGRMLVSTDPPRHRLLRQQMHPGFSGGLMARCGEQVTILVDAAIDRALDDGGCDFATTVARELPAGVLMVMLGVGRSDAHHLIDLTRRMIGFRDPWYFDTDIDERLRLAAIQSEVFEFFFELVRQRRNRPGPDVVSMLATAEINGRTLSDEDVIYNCMNTAVGGNETTSHTVCSGVVAMMEHPDQYDALLAQSQLLDRAINEILRWSSTNAYVQRIALRDTVVGGRQIRAGDRVTLWNASANRDPAQFDAPDEFTVARSPNRHLAYGNGIHRCIGAALAHLEMSVLLRRLLRDRITFAPAGEVVRTRSNFILGINSLPVRMLRGESRSTHDPARTVELGEIEAVSVRAGDDPPVGEPAGQPTDQPVGGVGRPAAPEGERLPPDELEDRVGAVWAAVLGLSDVDPEANFFDLGGTSLRLMLLHSRLRDELGLNLPLRALFAFPTVRAIARAMGAAGAPDQSGQLADDPRARAAQARRARAARRPDGDGHG